MKNSFIYLLFLTATISTFAQGPPPVLFTTPTNATYFENLITENSNFGRVVYDNDRNVKAVNKVYLFDDATGFVNVYTKEGKAYKVPQANFDLITQQLQVSLEDGSTFTFDLSNVDYFVKNNKKYVMVDNVARPLHQELVKSDKVTLLKGFTIIKKQAMTNPLTNQVTKPAFYDKDEAYFMLKNDKLVELPTKTKQFIKLFSEKEDELKDYIKSNHLSTDEDQDLIKIISYYDTL